MGNNTLLWAAGAATAVYFLLPEKTKQELIPGSSSGGGLNLSGFLAGLNLGGGGSPGASNPVDLSFLDSLFKNLPGVVSGGGSTGFDLSSLSGLLTDAFNKGKAAVTLPGGSDSFAALLKPFEDALAKLTESGKNKDGGNTPLDPSYGANIWDVFNTTVKEPRNIIKETGTQLTNLLETAGETVVDIGQGTLMTAGGLGGAYVLWKTAPALGAGAKALLPGIGKGAGVIAESGGGLVSRGINWLGSKIPGGGSLNSLGVLFGALGPAWEVTQAKPPGVTMGDYLLKGGSPPDWVDVDGKPHYKYENNVPGWGVRQYTIPAELAALNVAQGAPDTWSSFAPNDNKWNYDDAVLAGLSSPAAPQVNKWNYDDAVLAGLT
jgi:hypothetical protein